MGQYLIWYADEGDLNKRIANHKETWQKIDEEEIWKAAYHILSGLHILHRNSILHRDMKSANIFICDGVYKLGDLNVSKVNDNQHIMAQTQTGTPFYASPEIWRDEPYGMESDIWSFGCILY
jgi:NIMA (never in mitosis gene a)-related kinase 1/4/5